jgi:hypothetical protein
MAKLANTLAKHSTLSIPQWRTGGGDWRIGGGNPCLLRTASGACTVIQGHIRNLLPYICCFSAPSPLKENFAPRQRLVGFTSERKGPPLASPATSLNTFPQPKGFWKKVRVRADSITPNCLYSFNLPSPATLKIPPLTWLYRRKKSGARRG